MGRKRSIASGCAIAHAQSWTVALNLMRVAITLFRLLMVGALQIAPVWGKVLVRWTQPVVPPAAALGVNELVLAWNAGFDQLLQTARRQGYKVYVRSEERRVGKEGR